METKNFEPEPLSEEYYAALREYKKSDHPLTFGWFGSWSPQGAASLYYSLKSIPDSVDIVSILGIIRQSDAIPERRPEICSGSVGNTCYIHPILTQHGQSSR
ncbi:glycoside hydrolase family 18 [Bacteroides sp. BFG-551]|nr:glycoside hydrolase family 18 [Bacteroides sp. BFG-551]